MNCSLAKIVRILIAVLIVGGGCGKSENEPTGSSPGQTASPQPGSATAPLNSTGTTSPQNALVPSPPTSPPPPQGEAIAKKFGGHMELLTTGQPEWHLDLTRSKITDEDLAILDLPPEVVSVNLSHTGITDKGLEHLISRAPHVGRLDLMGTKITDQGLLHLRSMPNLWSVSVEGTNISVEAHKDLIAFLAPRLQEYLARQSVPRP